MFEYLETVTSQTAGLFRSGLPRLAEATPSSNAASRGFGPLVLVGLLLACGVVAFWRAVLAICAMACLVLFFIGILAVMSGAQNILRHASGDESPAAIQPAALTIRWPQPRLQLAHGNAIRSGPSATAAACDQPVTGDKNPIMSLRILEAGAVRALSQPQPCDSAGP
jgi:hypothetical protein